MKPIMFIALPLAIALVSLVGCSNASVDAVHAAFKDCAGKHTDFGQIKECVSDQLKSRGAYFYDVSPDSLTIRNFQMMRAQPVPGDISVECRRDREPNCSP